jgi:hypothetical protein
MTDYEKLLKRNPEVAQQFKDNLVMECDINVPLENAFNWDSTEEGYEFWESVYESLKRG